MILGDKSPYEKRASIHGPDRSLYRVLFASRGHSRSYDRYGAHRSSRIVPFEYPDGGQDLLGPRADFILCNDRSKMSCACQFRPDALCADRQETLLELLGVDEADRDSGMIEDAHHLARHVVRDDWALCAAAA